MKTLLFINIDGTREKVNAIAIKETTFEWFVTLESGEVKRYSAYHWTRIY